MPISQPGLSPSQLNATNIAAHQSKTATKEVAKNFEAVFLTQAFNQMLDTVAPGSFGGGHAEKTWKSFMGKEYAQAVADSGTTGIADSIENMIRAYGGTK
jgi:peptidoglycan hydrolase FlgJ